MHILLIEDDYAIRDALSMLLENEGHVVYTAEHGQLALTLLERVIPLPAVILLDLAMPVMNGWEFRATQQADPRLAHIPVVILSADRDVAHKARSISADAYVGKPVFLETLAPLLERLTS